MSVIIIAFFSSITDHSWSDDVLRLLETSGVRVIEPPEYTDYDDAVSYHRKTTLLFVGTGGTEHDVTRFIESTRHDSLVHLLTHPGKNSLAAALEISRYLHTRGVRVRIVHDALDHLPSRIHNIAGHLHVRDKIANARIGVIGQSSPWLIGSQVDPDAVEAHWGIRFTRVPLDLFLNRMQNLPMDAVISRASELLNKASHSDVSRETVISAEKVSAALERIISENQLDAVALECFNLLEKTGISGCCAVSHANDTPGIVASCEGDVCSAFTLLLAKILTSEPAFMANVIDLDRAAGTVTLAHCTVPLTMTSSFDITTHFETGRSVAIRGTLKTRVVTIFRVSGHDLSEYWVTEGEILKSLYSEDACRTQILVQLNSSVDYFLESPLGNHHIVIPGRHAPLIREFMDLVN